MPKSAQTLNNRIHHPLRPAAGVSSVEVGDEKNFHDSTIEARSRTPLKKIAILMFLRTPECLLFNQLLLLEIVKQKLCDVANL